MIGILYVCACMRVCTVIQQIRFNLLSKFVKSCLKSSSVIVCYLYDCNMHLYFARSRQSKHKQTKINT